MEAAAFLCESDKINNEQWRKFARRFFAEYCNTIMQYYGYERTLRYTLPIVVKYPRLFIAVMVLLLELEIIVCKKVELTNTLHEAFCFGKERSTIRKWFYDAYPEYEED